MIWDKLTASEQNALVGQTIFGYQITWRLCARDPDNGQWEEVQSHFPELRPGQVCWQSVAEMWPCYNWLDTDGPAKNGWDMSRLAEYRSTNDYDAYWRVVLAYVQDMRVAWRVVDFLMDRQQKDHRKEFSQFRFEKVHSGRQYAKFRTFDQTIIGASDSTVESAICKAGLLVFGVEV